MPDKPTGKTEDSGSNYDRAYSDNSLDYSLQSAREVVPLVMELLKPGSVIDVGCGAGAWLSVFADNKVADLLGVDGDYTDKTSLLIPEEQFLSHDLRNPLRLDREYDLVVSLEVAEHLPEKHADDFIESLTRLGPAILFSAAIPSQGGTRHVNEQWQDYWRKLFEKRDFLAVDYVRPLIWDNERIFIWYIQNTMLYFKRDYLESHDEIKRAWRETTFPLSLVHPVHYKERILRYDNDFEQILKALPRLIWNAFRRSVNL